MSPAVLAPNSLMCNAPCPLFPLVYLEGEFFIAPEFGRFTRKNKERCTASLSEQKLVHWNVVRATEKYLLCWTRRTVCDNSYPTLTNTCSAYGDRRYLTKWCLYRNHSYFSDHSLTLGLVCVWSSKIVPLLQTSGWFLMVAFWDLPEPAHLVVCAPVLIC